MRKLTALLMSFLLVFSLAACSTTQQAEETEQTSDSENMTETTDETTENSVVSDAEEESSEEIADAGDPAVEDTDEDADAESGKVLVVYYSATGSTEAVAGYIAEATDGDLFEITPVEPYTDEDLDWTNSDSRVSVEHDNEDQRDVELVSTTVEDWDSYDVVFIGYPIWWGIAAWPMNSFVEANDFTGKTVIPFCTSSSSGLGESGELLEELAGTGDWQEGQRFRSSASESDVTEWVDSLGL
ncbi:MAG: flavodoxin [Lachnospiraceae bacterium]|nr:flavodoxin [Lachnospiraceae bacterium]